MDKRILVSLVKKEAKNLKTKATKEEIRKLGFRTLRPQNRFACIYGQMVGDCFSPRANKLIKDCAQRVYNKIGAGICEASLNGKPKIDDEGDREKGWFSPIECFIDFKENQINGNNDILIDYIKGKTNKLTFNKF